MTAPQSSPIAMRGPFVGRLEAYLVAGRAHVTIVVKASCRIRDGRVCEPFDAEPWVEQDVYRGAPHRGAVLRARENALYLPRCDVFVTGRVYPPPGGDRGRVPVGLFIGRGARTLLAKYAEAKGTETHPDVTGMPLWHEYAYRGEASENPAGVATLEAATLRLIERPREPALFGPIAPNWSTRASQFNAAPLDQQVRQLYGDETVCLWGVDPDRARLSFTLPGIAPEASLHHPTWTSPRPLPMTLDTLAIDVEGGCLNLLWRACAAVPEPLPAVRAEAVMTTLASAELAPTTTHFDRVQIASANDHDTCPHAETLDALPPLDARPRVLPFVPPVPGERPSLPRLEPSVGPCDPNGVTELLDDRMHRERIDEGRRTALPFPLAWRRDRPAARTMSLGAAFMDLVHHPELAPPPVKKGDR